MYAPDQLKLVGGSKKTYEGSQQLPSTKLLLARRSNLKVEKSDKPLQQCQFLGQQPFDSHMKYPVEQ